jgi:hypothetical protein
MGQMTGIAGITHYTLLRKVVCQRVPPLETRRTKRRYTSFLEVYRRFVVSNPFHGLRVVPCKPM